jgi:hypothetical protein
MESCTGYYGNDTGDPDLRYFSLAITEGRLKKIGFQVSAPPLAWKAATLIEKETDERRTSNI